MKGDSATEIKEQLDRVLAWSAFQNSRRYPRFLKFIVNKTLDGDIDDIKERVIGVAVFDRPLNYEPATDPVVRLVAGEIRKRLAQYYVQPEHEHELRIEIPPGSYVPLFRWPQHAVNAGGLAGEIHAAHVPPGTPEAAVSSEPSLPWGALYRRLVALCPFSKKLRFVIGAAVLMALLVAIPAGLSWWGQDRAQRRLSSFWAPLLSNGPSTLICVGDWTTTGTDLRDALNRSQQGAQGASYIGRYDLGALARTVSILGRSDRPFSVLLSSDVTLTDLRSVPGILIGSINNRWTPTVLAGTRFQFRFQPGNSRPILVDSQHPRTAIWPAAVDSSQLAMSVDRDVALIARIVSPATGQVELVIAGSGPGGTTAASEFITNPNYFKQISSYAPWNWENRSDVEMIVTTDVINGRSGPPHLIRFDAR